MSLGLITSDLHFLHDQGVGTTLSKHYYYGFFLVCFSLFSIKSIYYEQKINITFTEH